MSAGRPPKQRDDFMTDAQDLLLLARAIENDKRRPAEWRDRVVTQILELQKTLLTTPRLPPRGSP